MSAVTADIPSTDVEEEKVPLKVAFSSFLGNFIEWFDYATYTYFAITIGQVFFRIHPWTPPLWLSQSSLSRSFSVRLALRSGAPWATKGREVVSVRLYSLHDRCSVPYRLPAVFPRPLVSPLLCCCLHCAASRALALLASTPRSCVPGRVRSCEPSRQVLLRLLPHPRHVACSQDLPLH